MTALGPLHPPPLEGLLNVLTGFCQHTRSSYPSFCHFLSVRECKRLFKDLSCFNEDLFSCWPFLGMNNRVKHTLEWLVQRMYEIGSLITRFSNTWHLYLFFVQQAQVFKKCRQCMLFYTVTLQSKMKRHVVLLHTTLTEK